MLYSLILIFFQCIPASAADVAAVNPKGIEKISDNGLITFFINGNPVYSNGPTNLPRNPRDCIIFNNRFFHKSSLSLDETPSASERSFKAATKLRGELLMDVEMESIPLMELSSLVEDIHVKIREASQNTNLNMREFSGIDKTLQSIQGELLNNTLKLRD